MNNILILRLSIKQRAIMVLSSCILLILFFLLGYYFSQQNHFVIDNSKKTVVVQSSDCQTTEQSIKQSAKLQKQITVLESDLQLERKTNALLKEKLTKYNTKITQLKSEISIYQGVINDSDENIGIYFQRISIKLADKKEQNLYNKKENKSLFKFSITLAKKNKSKTQQKGNIKLAIFDKDGNQNNKFDLLDVKGNSVKKLHVQFQNLIIKEGFFLLDKQSVDSKKEEKNIGNIKVSYIDSIKGDLDIVHKFDLSINKDISYVGK